PLRAARSKRILEAQKVKEIQTSRPIAVRFRLARGKQVLVAEEVEKIQRCVAITVRIAPLKHGNHNPKRADLKSHIPVVVDAAIPGEKERVENSPEEHI